MCSRWVPQEVSDNRPNIGFALLTASSFCRKTTMVKHQRRSHQRGLLPNEALDDCTSDSDSGESPMTPRISNTSWPTPAAEDRHHPTAANATLRRAQSYTDSIQQQYATHPQYSARAASHGQHDPSMAMVDQSNLVSMMQRTTGPPPEAF